MKEIMFCTNCGNSIENESVYCAYCGNIIDNKEDKEINNFIKNLSIMKKDMIIRIGILFPILIYVITAYPKFEPFPHMASILMAWMLFAYSGRISEVYDNSVFATLDNNHRQGFLVSPECSGFFIMLVFLFVIFVTPKIELKHRLYSLVFLPLLFLFNAGRVVSGIIFAHLTTSTNYPFLDIDKLRLYHSTVGQILIFLLMISSYILFLKIFGYFHIDKK